MTKQKNCVTFCKCLMRAGLLTAIVPMLMTGCRSSRTIGLLAPRTILPAPYAEPPGRTMSEVEVRLPAPPPDMDSFAPVPPFPEAGGEARTPEDAAPQAVEIMLPPPVESRILTYTVKKNDSLWTVARMYGITHQELAAYNKLDTEGLLLVNQVLNIPPGGCYIPPESRPKIRPRDKTALPIVKTSRPISFSALPAEGTYKVKAGDSLWKIARKYGLKSAEIRAINNLKTDTLQIDQILILPKLNTAGKATNTDIGGATPPAPVTPGLLKNHAALNTIESGRAAPVTPPIDETTVPNELVIDPALTPLTATPVDDNALTTPPVVLTPDPQPFPKKLDHLVSKGENLKMIAEMYGTTVEAIVKENVDIKSDDDLKPAMKIMVPYR